MNAPTSSSPRRIGEFLNSELSVLSRWWSLVRIYWRLLQSVAPLGKVALALIGLALAAYFGIEWTKSSSAISRLMNITLTGQVETSGQPYKGLEAFLLSQLRPQSMSSSEDTLHAFNEIKVAFTRLLQGSASIGSQQIRLVIYPSRGGTPPVRDQYITNGPQNFFLFVPGIVFPHPFGRDLTIQDLHATENSSDQLKRDIALANSIGPLLSKLDGNTIGEDRILQSYFIAETGVTVLRNNQRMEQHNFYTGQFKSSRFFPERPYFWGAFESTTAIHGFDYMSDPYVDLGGNGLVETHCDRLSSPEENAPAYVLCVDTAVSQGVVTTMRDRIRQLGGESQLIDCQASPDTHKCSPANPSKPQKEGLDWLVSDLQDAAQRNDYSSVFGQIILSRTSLIPNANALEFTVPVHVTLSEDEKSRDAMMLWAVIDLNQLRKSLRNKATLTGFGIALFLVTIVNLFQDYKSGVRAPKELMARVARVMEEAPTPFAWFDDKNQFVKANDSFIRFLEFDNFQDLVEDRRTFRHILTDASQRLYDGILKRSKQGEEIGSYDITVITKTGKQYLVTAHGERVPIPGLYWKTLPFRFGVFLRWKEMGNDLGSEIV